MLTTVVTDAKPFSQERTATILESFYREGFAHIPGVLTEDECARLRELIDQVFADPKGEETMHLYCDYVAVRLFEKDNFFRDMLVREPIISLAEAVLGDSCHLIAQNAVRNRPGEAISHFHADETVEFPVPDEMERHDARLQMPVLRMTVQVALTDTESIEYGPTECVPGSHYSGRQPNDKSNPSFEGRGPVPIHCKAGDIYLHNGQCWHRGAPNTSDRTRYLLQLTYGRRWIAQRFYPFLNYRMPDHVLAGASERLLRVLGKHPRGAYG